VLPVQDRQHGHPGSHRPRQLRRWERRRTGKEGGEEAAKKREEEVTRDLRPPYRGPFGAPLLGARRSTLPTRCVSRAPSDRCQRHLRGLQRGIGTSSTSRRLGRRQRHTARWPTRRGRAHISPRADDARRRQLSVTAHARREKLRTQAAPLLGEIRARIETEHSRRPREERVQTAAFADTRT